MPAKAEQAALLKREEWARKEARAARFEADAVRSRLTFLSEASRLLGSSLDYETTLGNLARLIVPELADVCVVDLADKAGSIHRVAVADVDREREQLILQIARVPSVSSRVFSTGESEWVPVVTHERCIAVPAHASPEVVRRLTFSSFISVALPVHGQILGSISLARSAPCRNYSSEDLALVEELAQRAGLAVDHARLYRASQEANSVKDQFLATLSHELRSPLSSALLCAQMLRRGILDEEKTARALETIERKIHMEVRLVDDLIDIARINAGKVSLEKKRVHVAALIDAVIEGMRPVALARGATLRFARNGIDASVYGDEARLQQALDNLLSNAIKFTPKGGSVDVDVEVDADLGVHGAEVRIAVRDTGIGISSAALPEVFDRFRQVDTSSTRKFGGLGLGLSISRTLVELHGGRIVAESAGEGLGSTFTIILPLLAASAYAAPVPGPGAVDRSAAVEDLSGVRVLLVDDDTDALVAMATLLATSGATVTKAASSREALAVLGQGSASQDVLVSDISMPDIDGYALLREIRARVPNDATMVPAIAVTACAGPIDRQMALAAGFWLHLSKPVADDELLAAVAELAGRRPARAASRRGSES